MNEGNHYKRVKQQVDSVIGELRNICDGKIPEKLQDKEYHNYLQLTKSVLGGLEIQMYDYRILLQTEWGHWNQSAHIDVFLIKKSVTDYPKEVLEKQDVSLKITTDEYEVNDIKITDVVRFLDIIHKHLVDGRFEEKQRKNN